MIRPEKFTFFARDITPRKLIGHLALATLSINLLGLALPLMTLQIYDRVLAHRSESTLVVLATGVIIAGLMESVLRMMRSWLSGWAGAKYEDHMYTHMLGHIMTAKLEEAEQKNTGDYLQDLAAIGRLRDYYGGQVLYALVEMPFILLFLGLILYLAGALVLAPIALLLIFLVFAKTQGAKLKQHLRAREANDNKRLGFTISVLKLIQTVKALSLEATLTRRFEYLQSYSGMMNYKVTRGTGNLGNMGYLFAQTMMVAMVSFGAPLVVSGSITMGTLIACVLLSGRIMQPLQRGLGLWVRMQDMNLAREQIAGIFTMPNMPLQGSENFNHNQGAVQCLDVSFCYNDTQEVLRDIHLAAQPGETIAISGGRGSGKTTLLELLAGLRSPTAGHVLLNGKEAEYYSCENLLRQVGYLPTQSVMFRGSVLENLTGFRQEKNTQALEAAKLLGIDQVISRMPMGYDTQLEISAADTIPLGLKQRIGIARVLVERPHILLFDNADRALDRDGYNFIYTLLGKLKGKATLILVSEDRNILSLADRNLVLENGCLVERFTARRRLQDERRLLRGVGL